jgi:hypothetical protein
VAHQTYLNAHPHCFGFAIRYYLLSAFLMQKKQYIYIKRFTNAYSSDFRITNPKKQV